MSKRNPDDYKITDPAEMIVKRQGPLTVPPGVFLRDTILPEHGVTNIAALARDLGVNRPALIAVLDGKHDVSRALAYKLGAHLGDAVADLLIAYQHKYDLQHEREEREAYKKTITRRQASEPA